MGIVINGYDFGEPLEGGDTGSFTFYDGNSASLIFRIPFTDIATAAAAALGQPHPYSIGAICLTLDWKPYGNYTDTTWDEAEVTLNFGKSKEPEEGEGEDPDDLGDIRISMNAETVSLPKKNFGYYTGGTPDPIGEDDVNPVKIIPLDQISITVNRIDAIDYDTISARRGKINHADFDIGPHTYGTGEVLFLGAESAKTFKADGNSAWNLTLNFAARPDGVTWNHVWAPAAAQWKRLQPVMYESADMTDLFD